MSEKLMLQRLELMKKESGVTMTNFKMPFSLKPIIQEMCKRKDISMNRFIELAVMEYVEKVEKMPITEWPVI